MTLNTVCNKRVLLSRLERKQTDKGLKSYAMKEVSCIVNY